MELRDTNELNQAAEDDEAEKVDGLDGLGKTYQKLNIQKGV